MSRQFRQRLLLSSLGALGLIICIYYSYLPFFKPIFILLNTSIICLALIEYYRLAEHKGFQPLIVLGVGSTVAYMIGLSFSFYDLSFLALPSFILLTSLLLLFLLYFNRHLSALANLAITAFGVMYLTIPLSCGVRINYFFPGHGLEDGRLWLAYVLIISKMTDIGAYFCGKVLGRIKLAPTISPKKTVEGALGGIGLAMVTSLLFSTQLITTFKMTIVQSVWISLAMSILSQLGDLAESLLKRDAGVKDSSHLPGLGGILDVVDSLVFTLPFMYLLLQMHVVG